MIQQAQPNWCLQVDCNKVAEFWRKLSPERPIFKPLPGQPTLYRGQANATWKLFSSASRAFPLGEYGNMRRDRARAQLELIHLRFFLAACDIAGLTIPGDTKEMRGALHGDRQDLIASRNSLKASLLAWPESHLHGLLALAQHYGVTTRLLDWSTRSFVAAYFAASDAVRTKNQNANARLAVWILNPRAPDLFPELEIVSPPGSNNLYLAAQAGKFTLLKNSARRAQLGLDDSLDTFLENFAMTPIKPAQLIAKVTLPVSLASELLSLCLKYGVSAATLFPGYAGAARFANDVNQLSLGDHPIEYLDSGINGAASSAVGWMNQILDSLFDD